MEMEKNLKNNWVKCGGCGEPLNIEIVDGSNIVIHGLKGLKYDINLANADVRCWNCGRSYYFLSEQLNFLIDKAVEETEVEAELNMAPPPFEPEELSSKYKSKPASREKYILGREPRNKLLRELTEHQKTIYRIVSEWGDDASQIKETLHFLPKEIVQKHLRIIQEKIKEIKNYQSGLDIVHKGGYSKNRLTMK